MTKDSLGTILLDEETIRQRVREVGAELADRYRDNERPPLFVCVLRGAVVFMTDLVRAMDIDVEFDFIRVSSYGSGTESSGTLTFTKDLETEILGRDVVIVEDIIDTGNTLCELKELLHRRKPKSLITVVLLNKKERRVAELEPDYECFSIEDRFIVGYGLDYDEKYRNLPYITCLD